MSNKILIADDVTEMRVLLEAILTSNGYQTVQAANGEEVFKQLNLHPDIDLILLDINMPDISGIEIIKTMRLNRMQGEFKVCFVSGEKERVMVQKALTNGGDDYIVKPIEVDILLSKIQTLLGQKLHDIEFNSVTTDLRGHFWNMPLMVDFKITELSELGLVFQSSIPMLTSGHIEISIPFFKEQMNTENHFSCCVDEVTRKGEYFEIKCTFAGLPEETRSKIKEIMQKGEPIIEKNYCVLAS